MKNCCHYREYVSKLLPPFTTPFRCLSVLYVRTWAKKKNSCYINHLDELDVCTDLDVGNVVRRVAVKQCGT
jgi:hypothetical protein